jgi:ABC-type multidrug transport system ATPase subunit
MLVSSEKVIVNDIGLTQAINYGLDDFRQSVIRYSVVNNNIKDSNSVSKGIRLDFTDLNYTVVRPSDGAVLELLKDINGTIPGGQMCALMGASGAGKSTLLDVLAARKNVGTITGKILFDGIERNSALSRNIAYVMQDDLHIPNLTVKETLYFAAELRMDESESDQAKLDRVNTVINMLLLSDVENSIVGGGVIRGLPGGKRRRVSIGVEIVNFPGLIFLDGILSFNLIL